MIAAQLHFKSVEHTEFQEKHGKEKGAEICKNYGIISGTLESIALVGLWISPQPTFAIPVFPDFVISVGNFPTPILHLIFSLPLIMLAIWFGIGGVRAVGFRVSETHASPEKIVSTGVYSVVRHPQYLGWMLAHIGISALFSAWYSLLFTPVLLVIIYLISRKEEEELIKEFGKEYEDYKKKVSMLIPLL
jgi:protein-S-isoprenylcysteine O-methyltransferase Ste14